MNNIVEFSTSLLMINIVLTFQMILICKPNKIYRNPTNNEITKIVFISIFILNIFHCIFAFWAEDTYHIWWDFLTERFSMEHYEGIYNWLANKTELNYFLWRSFIWITTLYLIYKSSEKLDLINRCFAVSFVLLNIFVISNTRGALGHSMLLYGIILLFYNKKLSLKFIMSCMIIYLSYFFHKSMYINLIFSVIALMPLKKNVFIISIIIFPLFVEIASRFINLLQTETISISYADNVGGLSDRTQTYVTGEAINININGIIGQFVKWIPTYLSLIYLCKRVIFQKYFDNIRNKGIYRYLFNLTYVCFYFGTVFSFVENTSSWIGIRFRYMGLFPLPFIIAKLWCLEKKTNNWIKSIIILSIVSILYTYIFTYKAWM